MGGSIDNNKRINSPMVPDQGHNAPKKESELQGKTGEAALQNIGGDSNQIGPAVMLRGEEGPNQEGLSPALQTILSTLEEQINQLDEDGQEKVKSFIDKVNGYSDSEQLDYVDDLLILLGISEDKPQIYDTIVDSFSADYRATGKKGTVGGGVADRKIPSFR